MNCANHPEAPAVAYCRTCGKPLCNVCVRDAGGVMYCDEHIGAQPYGMPPPAASVVPPAGARAVPAGTPNPRTAAIVGVIPGVGAMYNGEFAKAFVHVLIFAVLILMTSHINGIFGLGIAAWVIYMPIEAYKTAHAQQLGVPPPDPLGLNALFGSGARPGSVVGAAAPTAGAANVAPGAPDPSNNPPNAPPTLQSRVPMGAIILIGLGVLFLLDEMDLLHFQRVIERFWPLILIALGVRILMRRQQRGY